MNCLKPLAVASLLALTLTTAAFAQEGPQNLQTIPLNAGIHIIHAQVAMTPLQREIGLMHRPEMPTNDGMLFVFEQPSTQCFWMKNTLLPLAVAFIADDGSIVSLDEMKPQTLDSHCSEKPVRYVLEMNTGWFSKRGLKPGSRLTGAPFTKAAGAAASGAR